MVKPLAIYPGLAHVSLYTLLSHAWADFSAFSWAGGPTSSWACYRSSHTILAQTLTCRHAPCSP